MIEKTAFIMEAYTICKKEDVKGALHELRALKQSYCKFEQDHNMYDKSYRDEFYRLETQLKKKYYKQNEEAKLALIERAKEVLESQNYKKMNVEANQLFDEWRTYGPLEGSKNEAYYDTFKGIIDDIRKLCNDHFRLQKEGYHKALLAKQDIINKAEQCIAKTQDETNCKKQLIALQQAYKTIGYAGKSDAALWQSFQSIQATFYHSLEEKRKLHEASKRLLIQKAKAYVEDDIDFKKAKPYMKSLVEDWKQVGYAGRVDALLWNEFHSILNAFYEKQNEYFANNKIAKKRCIDDMKQLLALGVYSKHSANLAKQVHQHWKQLGYAGKDDVLLYQEFRSLLDQFFEHLHIVIEARKEERYTYLESVVKHKQEQITKLKDHVNHLKSKQMLSMYPDFKERMAICIEEDEAKIYELHRDIEAIQEKLKKLSGK